MKKKTVLFVVAGSVAAVGLWLAKQKKVADRVIIHEGEAIEFGAPEGGSVDDENPYAYLFGRRV
jgi:hypothetical protein